MRGDRLFRIPTLTEEEITVLRHGLKRLCPSLPNQNLLSVDSDRLQSISWSLDTALAEAVQHDE
jgi:hypothetical protein